MGSTHIRGDIKMRISKDVKTVRDVVRIVGEGIIAQGAGADKVSAFACLVNSYSRLLLARRSSSRQKPDPYAEGDPSFHQSLLEE